jgi:hypothetical protein
MKRFQDCSLRIGGEITPEKRSICPHMTVFSQTVLILERGPDRGLSVYVRWGRTQSCAGFPDSVGKVLSNGC